MGKDRYHSSMQPRAVVPGLQPYERIPEAHVLLPRGKEATEETARRKPHIDPYRTLELPTSKHHCQ